MAKAAAERPAALSNSLIAQCATRHRKHDGWRTAKITRYFDSHAAHLLKEARAVRKHVRTIYYGHRRRVSQRASALTLGSPVAPTVELETRRGHKRGQHVTKNGTNPLNATLSGLVSP